MDILKIFLISAVPLTEQRVSIPLGILYYNIDPFIVFAVSFLGSLLPVPFILLLFNIIFDWMKRFRIFNGISTFIERKVVKGSAKVQKYEKIGLILFVAIPLPTTGLWTGSAIAAFFKLDIKKSFLYIALGGIISATLITAISLVFPTLLGY